MTVSYDLRAKLQVIAGEVLPILKFISDKAKHELASSRALGESSLVNPTVIALSNLHRAGQAVQSSYRSLAAEPAIARVSAVDEKNQLIAYYICRSTPVTGVANLASYRSPVGRLASLDIGSDLRLPNGRILQVIDRTQLHPSQLASGWESVDSVVETEYFGPLTVESLRALLETNNDAVIDFVGQLLDEDSMRANVFNGIRRNVITKMGLKDQPILDRYQDEVFRLPLAKRLVLLGPPGTGKTTTLIRRLGQKLDLEYLDEDERKLLKIVGAGKDTHHLTSWLMFTPNELLRQYLKEAFAREGVPASDQRIKTWNEMRRELGRSAFGVLKTATGSGTYVLKDQLDSLKVGTQTDAITWFNDFDGWQRSEFIVELEGSAKFLSKCLVDEASNFGNRMSILLREVRKIGIGAMLVQLVAEHGDVQKFHGTLRALSDEKIKSALNRELQKDRKFLEALAQFMDTLQPLTAAEVDDSDEADLEDEDLQPLNKTALVTAINVYLQAVRSQARAFVTKRTIQKTSRTGKILEWVGNRSLSDKELDDVGQSLLIQASARQFLNPAKRYVDGIHRRYRAFRRQRQSLGRWYAKDGFDSREIHPLELDIILLSILRGAGNLVSRANVLRDIEKPEWGVLKALVGQFRNQILVDEATDFSPIQLACMGELTHPRLRSFFACGDFNQRLTSWGLRSAEELKWVFADVEIKEISIAYRQSKELNEFARALIQNVENTAQTTSLPKFINSEGVAPTLLEHASKETVITWLADRIREIERFVGQLPSIAIFVISEEEVEPVTEALNVALAENNIQVIACREGQTVGQESNVRVFDIQHIKGLEFEAVFFIGIDKLAVVAPKLFDKYLYVGTTRAATYLGITCEDCLPSPIEKLRSYFKKDWRAQVVIADVP